MISLATIFLNRASNINTNTSKRRTNVQVKFNSITLNRFLVIHQVLAIPDCRISHNLKWDDGVLVLALHKSKDSELVDAGLHGDRVLAGLEDKVGEERVADGFAVDIEIHGGVAEIEGHDGGVGNVYGADHVGAVGEDFFGAGEDLDVADVEALKLVQTCVVVSGVD